MNHFQAFVLGAVQGWTEFLPISSSAHLILVPWFFGWEDPGLAFDVFLHFGTLFGVVIYFHRDLYVIVTAGIASILERRIGANHDRRLFWYLVIGSVPAALAGVLLHSAAETMFRNPLLIAISLATVGFFLYWMDEVSPAVHGKKDIGLKQTCFIGLAQALAIIPGVSRSGATITMARFLGFQRETAARFSFLLSIPIILGACLYEGNSFFRLVFLSRSSGVYWTAFLTSMVSSIMAIHFLLAFVRTADFKIFAWYRLFLALGIVMASLVLGTQ